MKQTKTDYEKQLIDSYERWNYLYQHGGSDPNYQFLVSNGGQLSKEDAKAVCYGAVVGYVHNLEEWLSRLCQIKDGISEREFSDILVNLRRYENAAGYQESFARCRRKIETILQKRQNFIWNFVEEKNGQLCLF